MNEAISVLVLVVILAIVARSMIGLTRMATDGGTLATTTRRILQAVPAAIYAFWAVALLVRLFLQSAGTAMWPFELAIAVSVWLCWVAVVAAVLALRDAALRLTRRSAGTAGAAPKTGGRDG